MGARPSLLAVLDIAVEQRLRVRGQCLFGRPISCDRPTGVAFCTVVLDFWSRRITPTRGTILGPFHAELVARGTRVGRKARWLG